MKRWSIFCAVALVTAGSFAATIPCSDESPLIGIEFNEFRAGSYQQIQIGFGSAGIATISSVSGECFDIREVDQSIHNDVFGDRAFTVDEQMRIDFRGQKNWGVVVYIGADTFDQERHSCLACYASGERGEDDILIGGDCGQTTFGPEELIDELGDPEVDRGFQYLLHFVSRRPFLNYVPRSIAYCILDPDGEDVFVGLVQCDTDEVTPVSRPMPKPIIRPANIRRAP